MSSRRGEFLSGSLCVCDRGRPSDTSHEGDKTETSVSGSNLTRRSLPQYTHTHTHTHRTLLTELTGELSAIDNSKQWNHVETPTLLKDNTRVSLSLSHTHTHTALTPASQTAHPPTATHIHEHCLSLSPSLWGTMVGCHTRLEQN